MLLPRDPDCMTLYSGDDGMKNAGLLFFLAIGIFAALMIAAPRSTPVSPRLLAEPMSPMNTPVPGSEATAGMSRYSLGRRASKSRRRSGQGSPRAAGASASASRSPRATRGAWPRVALACGRPARGPFREEIATPMRFIKACRTRGIVNTKDSVVGLMGCILEFPGEAQGIVSNSPFCRRSWEGIIA